MTDTCKGMVNWTSDDFIDVLITLFKEKPSRIARNGRIFEKKDWILVLDNETQSGKRKAIATSRIDFSTLVRDIPSQKLVLKMKPLTKRLKSATVTVYTTSTYEGKPRPGDAMSEVGSTTSDNTMMLGNITDYDDSLSHTSTIESGNSKQFQQDMAQMTNQFELLTNSFGEDRPSSIASSNKLSNIQEDEVAETDDFNKRTPNNFDREDLRRATLPVLSKSSPVRRSPLALSKDDTSTPIVSETDGATERDTNTSSASFNPNLFSTPTLKITSPSHSEETTKLLMWCQNVTSKHPGVKVTNFTTSWRNGLALCALLHHFHPDKLDYSELRKLDGIGNTRKALKVLKELDIEDYEQPTTVGQLKNKQQLIKFLSVLHKHFTKKSETESENPLCQPPETDDVNQPQNDVTNRIPSLLAATLQQSSDLTLPGNHDDDDCDDIFERDLDSALLQYECSEEECDSFDDRPVTSQRLSPVNVTSQNQVEESPSTAVDEPIEYNNKEIVQERPNIVNLLEKISPPEILAEPAEKPEIPEKISVENKIELIQPLEVSMESKSEGITINKNEKVQPLECDRELGDCGEETKTYVEISENNEKDVGVCEELDDKQNNNLTSEINLENNNLSALCVNGSNKDMNLDVEEICTIINNGHNEEAISVHSAESSENISEKSKNGETCSNASFDDTVNNLIDSARERTKKSKIMELLENAKKANALQESNEEIDDEELERKRKIRERAHMLISQTRKSIEREDFTDNKIESKVVMRNHPVHTEFEDKLPRMRSVRKSRPLSQADANLVKRLSRIMGIENAEEIMEDEANIDITPVAALEAQQQKLDNELQEIEERSAEVQMELQQIKQPKMFGRNNQAMKQREEDLAREWIQIVNKKNRLVIQQDQLCLAHDEQRVINEIEEIERKVNKFANIEEHMKSDAMKQKEEELIMKKIALVNEKNEIIHRIDEKEEEAAELEEHIQGMINQDIMDMEAGKENCVIM